MVTCPYTGDVTAHTGCHRGIDPNLLQQRWLMSDHLNRHDANALRLIDQALSQGRFTPELVAQVSASFALAEREEPTTTASQ